NGQNGTIGQHGRQSPGTVPDRFDPEAAPATTVIGTVVAGAAPVVPAAAAAPADHSSILKTKRAPTRTGGALCIPWFRSVSRHEGSWPASRPLSGSFNPSTARNTPALTRICVLRSGIGAHPDEEVRGPDEG